MSILHYSEVTGPSRALLDDAFAATFYRLVSRFPHLTRFRFSEDGQDVVFEEYVRPESLIALTALDMALRLMRRINPGRIRVDQWLNWEKRGTEHVLHVTMDIPVFWLVPPLELGFYLTSPLELWKPSAQKHFSAREETWNVITQSRTLFSA
ncbi:hypothetical protein [Acidithiobacillus ferrooxidans]|jgi:hypothetical protein|uniref:hypothetical protein n=1 Tax=Acidithiobacillus ferrooxidans TaxID=920 RepID=UPI000A640B3F|nr:hypothetical protein [Acidithiobacillus ferrooxidans]